MIGFHIDMNVGQFSRPYLERWLKDLARSGYDTIVWEVENNVAWETCPECASPDAFSKSEFTRLLNLCRELGLESIPLLQTIGHAEYALKHAKYEHLKEMPDKLDQYCPQNPQVLEFLHRWIQEYLELFGEVKRFHLGADEAFELGWCEKCKQFAAQHSLSQLYIDHINALSRPLVERGVTPIIWGDMVLRHPEAMALLSRNIMVFDWMYDLYRGNSNGLWIWGKGLVRPEQIPADALQRFGQYMYPHGHEPGREPEPFYAADYLASQGFAVVTCPGSSHYGDNVFSPRHFYHMANTWDSLHKGLSSHLKGSVLTSWSVHLHPWELQLSAIDMAGFIQKYPKKSLQDYQEWFLKRRFGVVSSEDGKAASQPDFFHAAGLLSRSCLFTYTSSLGYYKSCLPVPRDHVSKTLTELQSAGKLEAELENCQARLEEYKQALLEFGLFADIAPKGHNILDIWKLEAQNLINRAAASIFLIRRQLGQNDDNGKAILESMRQLRTQTDRMYRDKIRPTRRREYLHFIYDAMDTALAEAIEAKDPQSQKAATEVPARA